MIALRTLKFYYATYIIIFTALLPFSIKTENIRTHADEHIEQNIAQACTCDFCNEITLNSSLSSFIFNEKSNKSLQNTQKNTFVSKRKKRTILVFVAADNDLSIFAGRNLKQMATEGSNEYINIVVQLDIRISGNKKITRRYFVEKNTIWHVNAEDPLSQCMDSGNPATLISFCEWAITHYPAEKYDLFLWNHGTGILEPLQPRVINPTTLFMFNPAINKLELDRSISFMDFLNTQNSRGVCWDDSTGHYLSNRKLALALETICSRFMNKETFEMIIFDACLMSMIEVASSIKNYAKIMVGSQEVELGMGLNYADILAPLAYSNLDTVAFAKHIVTAYEKTYSPITNDYTYSAINLENIHLLEKNINIIAQLLFNCLKKNKKSSISNAIYESRNKFICTHFDEPSYIDLHHFYVNLLNNIKKITPNSQGEYTLKNSLIKYLEEGITLINTVVIANVTGKNLKNAHGISIYFPEHTIHSSYQEAEFLKTNQWGAFLSYYVFS